MKKNRFSLKMPKGYSKAIHASVIMLTFFSILMIVSANVNANNRNWTSLLVVIAKEFVFVVISYIMMIQAARNFSITRFRKYYRLLLIVTFTLLILPRFFGSAGGAYAWIRFGGFSIQPSEFAKVAVILIVAYSLGDVKEQRYKVMDLLMHPLVVVGAMVLIVLLVQKDLGSALIIALIAFFCALIPNNRVLRKVQYRGVLLFGLFVALLFFLTTETGIAFLSNLNIPTYMIERFKTSANPFLDKHNTSGQIYNGLAAFVSGGLFGVGYGKGYFKYNYIYAAESDSILAIIVEELGVVFGFLPIIILYSIIIYHLMRYTFYLKSDRERIILVGTIAYFFAHFLLNVGGVTALIPLTGVPLLLISAGGSSRMAIMLAIGLSQSVISRYRSKHKDI